MEDIRNNFWSKVDQQGPNDCWLWLAGKIDGYGVFYINRKPFLAHRISYCLKHNTDITKAKVLHHCDNPSCVNPNHLFEGTQKDNIKDMHNKRRFKGGSPSGYYEGEVFLMRKLFWNGISLTKIAKIFRVKYPSNIGRVIHNPSYRYKESI